MLINRQEKNKDIIRLQEIQNELNCKIIILKQWDNCPEIINVMEKIC